MKRPPLRILTIEDDPQDVEILRRHLADIRDWELDLRAVADCAQGLADLAHAEADIVFVDYLLGAETGLTALRAIRESAPSCPVVLLTGQGDEELAVEAMHAGAADYLPKASLTPQSLRRVIRTALEKGRMKNLLAEYRGNLERTNKDLERRNNEIQGFYHTLSHELKTPLTSTLEFVSMMLEGVAGNINETQREYLGIAMAGCQEMLVSINDLLDASRLESGKLSIQQRPTNLGALVRRLCTSLQPTAQSRGITLESGAEADLPDALVDEARISQVLSNLISNALKFTPRGGSVRVHVTAESDEPQLLRVAVSDTGRGIDAEHLDLVFDRLYQVHASDSQEAGGLGLGLNLCRELVRLHGGEISVKSAPGSGSIFAFTVPVAPQGETLASRRKVVSR